MKQEYFDRSEATLIVTSSWNNKIRIFDEKKNQEDNLEDEYQHEDSDLTQKKPRKSDNKLVLRKFNGSQLGDMVVCMTISKHHSLVATGNQFGLVVIWNLESGKMDKVQLALLGCASVDPLPTRKDSRLWCP